MSEIIKKKRKIHGTLLYLKYQIASTNSVNQKSNPDCHI